MSDIEDEIEMVLALYTDECERDESRRYAVLLHLPFRFEVQVTIPSTSYPEESYPQVNVLAGPNAQLVSQFSTELHRRMREEVPLGFPALVSLIGVAEALAEEIREEREREETAALERLEAAEEAILKDLREMRESGIEITSSDAISDKRSKFVAHMAPVRSDRHVQLVLSFLRSQKNIAAAHHPAIYAYRYTDESGIMQRNNDDDGEDGAAGRIAFILEQLNVDGYIVVVTRWFGGILLGPIRFKHIMEVTKNILLTIPEADADVKGKPRKGSSAGT